MLGGGTMEITIDHIQGFITALIPVALFIFLHYFIDKGKLTINKKDYYIKAYQSDGGGGFEETPLAANEYAYVKIMLTLDLLLNNIGKRKISITSIQIENRRLENPIIIPTEIIELDAGTSKSITLKLGISYYEANTIIDYKSIMRIVDNKGKTKKIKLGEATTTYSST
jgi:hypothetical protein